eukprot:gnl/TRDRNA2_/TRDRNA2_197356_c0_seq1.p1 gnl/TRDRNA2_/TRDRNA2_197356_c0~~gnl/TRDRNA2_/TRDRNA2_197356_c0_seq1.p1  ORF type:complete len:222 (+),score=51.82 gnl/TRDRNA2_/TRDRNA2_197356_c0_seq1:65-667(+)
MGSEKKEKKERSPKKKGKSGWFNSESSSLLLVAVAIAVMRFNGIPVPLVDNLIAKVKQDLWPAPKPLGPGEDVEATMKEVRAGKAIVLNDVLYQLKHFCHLDGKGDCSEWLEALPQVAASVRMGPGTWDRKAFPKAKTLELDKLLGSVVSMSAVADNPKRQEHLRVIMKYLVDSAPKKLKGTLMSSDPPKADGETTVSDE